MSPSDLRGKDEVWNLADSIGNFLSYGFAPASVVAPLGTVVSHPSSREGDCRLITYIGTNRQLPVRTSDSSRAIPSQGTRRYGPSDPWSRHCCILFQSE